MATFNHHLAVVISPCAKAVVHCGRLLQATLQLYYLEIEGKGLNESRSGWNESLSQLSSLVQVTSLECKITTFLLTFFFIVAKVHNKMVIFPKSPTPISLYVRKSQ